MWLFIRRGSKPSKRKDHVQLGMLAWSPHRAHQFIFPNAYNGDSIRQLSCAGRLVDALYTTLLLSGVTVKSKRCLSIYSVHSKPFISFGTFLRCCDLPRRSIKLFYQKTLFCFVSKDKYWGKSGFSFLFHHD
jgi:hypothetical protein